MNKFCTYLRQNWWLFLFPLGLLLLSSEAYAYNNQLDQSPTLHDNLVLLLKSSLGTLLIIFLGLGGLAFVYLQRQGQSSKESPIAGILMLLGAIALFIMRVSLNSGFMGAKYLDYGP